MTLDQRMFQDFSERLSRKPISEAIKLSAVAQANIEGSWKTLGRCFGLLNRALD
jgi:hypothetical protein